MGLAASVLLSEMLRLRLEAMGWSLSCVAVMRCFVYRLACAFSADGVLTALAGTLYGGAGGGGASDIRRNGTVLAVAAGGGGGGSADNASSIVCLVHCWYVDDARL